METSKKTEAPKEAGGAHYGKLQPWHLQQHMITSGDSFVDGRRCDIIKYAFRVKDPTHTLTNHSKMLDDLHKVKDCVEAAIKQLEHPELIPKLVEQ